MYAVNLLKRIVDVIHEEINASDHKQLDQAEISDKDKVIAELYRINIQLENKLRLYEKDFDVFTALHPSVATFAKEEHDAAMKDVNTKEQPAQPPAQPANTTHQPPAHQPPTQTHTHEKRDRREYMREYHKNYRKKNRENNIEVNL